MSNPAPGCRKSSCMTRIESLPTPSFCSLCTLNLGNFCLLKVLVQGGPSIEPQLQTEDWELTYQQMVEGKKEEA